MDMKEKRVTVALFCPPFLRLVGLTFFPLLLPFSCLTLTDHFRILAHIVKFSEFSIILFIVHISFCPPSLCEGGWRGPLGEYVYVSA